MKGLIIKDFLCLKKQLSMFVMLVLMTVIVTVLFVLSSKYGNLALAKNEMLETGQIDQAGLVDAASFAVMLFLLVPIAAVTDIGSIFKEDAKAGFASIAAVMPLTIRQRVTARYFTVFSILVAGIIIDGIMCFLLSLFTDVMKFGESVNMIFAVAALIAISSGLLILFSILFGRGKEDFALVTSSLLLVVMLISVGYKRIKAFFVDEINFTGDMMNFIKTKSYIMVFVAFIIVLLCYIGSVVIAERKRGVM